MRLKAGILLLMASLLFPQLIFAQSINAAWNRWDAQITVNSNSDQMQIAETQEIQVLNGTIHTGDRIWTHLVQVQSVYVNLSNDQTPRALAKGNGTQPGTYAVSQASNDQTTLKYALSTPQNAGDTFVVQINYTATSPTTGMVDWVIVPGDHAFPVRSSTVRIHFPSGQAPDTSLARVSNGNGTAQISGNDLIIQSQGEIAAQQPFAIQVPYGAGVGAAGSNPNNNPNTNPVGPDNGVNPANPNPGPDQGTPGTSIQLPGLGTILMIVCGLGLLLLLGGGGLLRTLLGGFLGGALGGRGSSQGGPFGGTGQGPFNSGNQNPFQGSNSSERGFRPSSNQDREIGNIGNDKDRGGGAHFG